MPKEKDIIDIFDMVGGCCVCSDDRGWTENPLVYCDGIGCNVAVHQACYGIVTIPTSNWYCRKCETPDLDVVKCELCPSSSGALKPSDTGGWAHVVCALYIPEVSFGNVTTMEPIIINQVPQERFNKTCYICEEEGKGAIARVGACMQCNRSGCRQVFHVTCAQQQGLLCEEAGNYQDNVKYCGYCHHHYNKLKKGSHVKTIPPFRPLSGDDDIHDDDSTSSSHRHSHTATNNSANKRKISNRSSTPSVHQGGSESSTPVNINITGDTSRPATPSAGLPTNTIRPISPSFNSTNGGNNNVVKVNSIVVQVPLEAAGVDQSQSGNNTGNQRLTGNSPVTIQPQPSSPSVSDSSSHHGPAKRSRSESSESKGEKRRSKRSGQSSGQSHNSQHTLPSTSNSRHSKNKSPSRVKSSPEPVTVGGTSQSGNIKIASNLTSSSSNGSNNGAVVIKEEKDVKLFENGISGTGAAHMLGNELAPGSSLSDTLSQEVQAHSIYTKSSTNHQGPQFPKPTQYRGPGANTGLGPWGSSGSNMPQTLEQLLERQWEQGSQFLMEQAHHFDIASLLSCLHQLKAENAQLEEHVNSLQARRDNLLAVNARLAIPLVSPHHPPGGNNITGSGRIANSSGNSVTNPSVTISNANLASAVLTNSTVGNPASGTNTVVSSGQIVENGIPSPHEQYRLTTLHRVDSHRGNSSSNSNNLTTSNIFTSSSTTIQQNSHPTVSVGQQHQNVTQHQNVAQHQNVGHQTVTVGQTHHNTSSTIHTSVHSQNSVVVRASSNNQSQSQSRNTTNQSYPSSSFSTTSPQVLVRRSESEVHNKSTSGS